MSFNDFFKEDNDIESKSTPNPTPNRQPYQNEYDEEEYDEDEEEEYDDDEEDTQDNAQKGGNDSPGFFSRLFKKLGGIIGGDAIEQDFSDKDENELNPPKEPTPEELEEMREQADTIELPRYRRIKIISIILCVLILIGGIVGYFIYWHPYSETTMNGFVSRMELRGYVFKTNECRFLEEKHFLNQKFTNDTTLMSIPNDSLAQIAKSCYEKGKMVTITYQEYKKSLIWRGDEKRIITNIIEVDSVTSTPVDNNKK